MTHSLVISGPSVMPLQVRTWVTSVLPTLPYPTTVRFRTTSRSPGSPFSVKVMPSESTTCEGCRNGRCSTTFQLPPLWDLRARANTLEVIHANLALAVRHAAGAELPDLDGAYRLIGTRTEAEAWIKVRQKTHVLAIDIEGDGDPSTVHPSKHEIICLGIHDGTETVILPEELFLQGLWPELADLLEGATTVAHNGKFDSSVLGWVLRGKNHPIYITHDTMLAHYALWPAGGNDDEHADKSSTSFAYHGLKLLGDLYLACGNWALARIQYENMRTVPLDELYRYNAKDVQRTHLLLQLFRDQFAQRQQQLHAYINVLMPASNHLTWQEDTGVCVDVPYVKAELIPGMTQNVEEATRDLIYKANLILPGHTWPLVAPAKRLPGETPKEARRFNPGSADQVRIILESQGVELPIDRKSKSNKGSTSKRTLELLMRDSRKGDPFLTRLLERRKVEKILGTYALPLATRTHTNHPYSGLRIFPGLHLHKTLTGRLASSNPNIQNQPKLASIRRAYVPSGPGRVVFQVDFSQAELRVMAVLGNDRFLTKIFKNPSLDVFDGMMPEIFSDVDFEKNPEKFSELRRPLKACVPLNTMILTRRGWLKHDEVRVGDETPGLTTSGRTEWTRISAIHHPGKQKMYRLGHSRWNFLCTSDHRWAVGKRDGRSNRYSEPIMMEAKDITRDSVVYVAGELTDNNVAFLTDDEVRIIAWIQSDGYLRVAQSTGGPAQGSDGMKRQVNASIQQAKPQYVEEIKSLLKDVPHGVTTRPGINHETAYNFVISSPWMRDLLTRAGLLDGGGIEDFILRLPVAQRHIWLDTFWKAEGHMNGKARCITQKRGEKADAVALAGYLCGYRVSVTSHTRGSDVVKILLSHVTDVGTNTMTMTEQSEEEVWCVTTENGNWTARQGDVVANTGNCIYGLAFARGAKDIAEDLGMEVSHTQGIIDGFLSSAIGIARWRQDVVDHIQHGIPLVSRLGRYFLHQPISELNREDINRSALSFLPQSSASDCCLLAAVDLGNYIRKNNLDWDMSALIHDAIILDVPQEQVEEAMKITGDFMVASAAKWFPEVPFAVDGTWGWSWADFDDKAFQKKVKTLTSDEIRTVRREDLMA
jgi:DNA polymerase I-like protein with 3'-5' exonuclease and polymerase domains